MISRSFLVHFALYKYFSKSSAAFVRSYNMSDRSSGTSLKAERLPTMIVFDLDDCLWTPEMHTLGHPGPTKQVKGKVEGFAEELVIGMKCANGPTVKLFDGARKALIELATDRTYQDIIIAVASSSLEPTYSDSCLSNIEVIPGVTMRSMVQFAQIGRTGKLSSRKTTHFKLLHEESGVPYNEMLFFDDCNWGDHVGDVGNVYGVIGYRTPYGLQLSEFYDGLASYNKAAKDREWAAE